MSGLGLDVSHALLVGIVPAAGKDLLGEMRNGKDVNVLVAVGLPELGRLYENVFFGVYMKKAGRRKLGAVVETLDIEISGIAFSQDINGFGSCHTCPPSKKLR